jgi:cytidylate kinase
MARNIVADNPAIARLVERQMRNQELAREQRFEVEKVSQSPVEEFVCISRQVGTDGPGLAQDLGRRLGWPVFDREILDEMAGDDAVRRQVYESMDQRDLSWWEESLRALMQSEFVRNDYFQKLSETLLSLARQGNCVFLGRGADLLLPESGGIRVRLVAPLVERIKRVAKINDLTGAEAKRWIERKEAERQSYLRRHFGVEADDPVRYDIMVNVARFTRDEAIRVILGARSMREPSP